MNRIESVATASNSLTHCVVLVNDNDYENLC